MNTDPFGDSPLPFNLLSFPGEIHLQVLKHINTTYGFESEVTVEGFLLRIDLVDKKSNGDKLDAYEVKPVSYKRDYMLLQAVWQLDNYIVKSNYKYKPGTTQVKGVFQYKDFVVSYWLEAPGIILYSFVYKPKVEEVVNPLHVPLPFVPKKSDSQQALGEALVLVFALSAANSKLKSMQKKCLDG